MIVNDVLTKLIIFYVGDRISGRQIRCGAIQLYGTPVRPTCSRENAT